MTILVTGATGNIGRRIVDHLIDMGANDIRALTTNPDKAKLPDGSHRSAVTWANPNHFRPRWPASIKCISRRCQRRST